ncbi:MAG TPA: hypothetical protein VKS01_09700 [Bryobacteraceae bacterium]|nr:hypothetical protein [Bryobacteraceae bacterium]
MKLAILLASAACALAQDPFEIHVYEYETLHPWQFTLEQHLNYWAIGARQFDGPLAPTNDQLHMTYELTAGITDQFSIGFMQLNAVLPGVGFQYAGWRVLPHFYAPESWHLPVKLGLVAEFSFARPQYIADTAHVEIRPIVEKKVGDWQVDFNPVFGRALRGAGVSDGWEFEPAARIAHGDEDRKLRPYLEWYSELGSLPEFLPVRTEVHQIYPGVDWKLAENLLWSVGIGVGLTPQQPRLVIKSRIEFEFGRRSP